MTKTKYSNLQIEDRYRIYNIVHQYVGDHIDKVKVGDSILVDFDIENCGNFKIVVATMEQCREFLHKKYMDAAVRMSKEFIDSDDEEDTDTDSDSDKDKDKDPNKKQVLDYIEENKPPEFETDHLDLYSQYDAFKVVRADCEDGESNILIVITGAHKEMYVDTYNLTNSFLSNSHNYLYCEAKETDLLQNEKLCKLIEQSSSFSVETVRKIMEEVKIDQIEGAVLQLVGSSGQSTIICTVVNHETALNSLERWLVHPDKIKYYMDQYKNRGDKRLALCAYCHLGRHIMTVRQIDLNKVKPGEEFNVPKPRKRTSHTMAPVYEKKDMTKRVQLDQSNYKNVKNFIKSLTDTETIQTDTTSSKDKQLKTNKITVTKISESKPKLKPKSNTKSLTDTKEKQQKQLNSVSTTQSKSKSNSKAKSNKIKPTVIVEEVEVAVKKRGRPKKL